jgi:tetratricopeptide (TPR) repeat protein
MAGSAIGTPEYMSPEQAAGRINELGPSTDVYSLGATFFCLLTGQPPIDGEQVSEKLEKAKQGKFPRPSELDSSIPKPLEAVCLKAMAWQPEDRYQSPAGISDDIERWLADERVSAYPEPWLSRAARTLRKNRTAAIALTAATAMAIVGLIGMNLVSRSKNIEIQAKNTQIESANSELKIVNEELSESKDAIKENYRSFRSLTAKLIQKAERDLSQTPETIKVREWLTSQTLELFRKFESENEDADNEQFIDSEDSKIWLAQLYRYEANAIRNANRVDESINDYEIATSILRSVVADNPDSAPGIGFLSETLRDYANTIGLTGKTELAIRMSEEALDLSGKLLAKYPDSINCQRLEATNLIDAASLIADIDATKSALYTDRAIQLSRPINEGDNVVPNDVRTIIFALMRRSFLDRKSGAIDKAKESADEAIVWAREQLKKRDTRASRHMLARTLLERSRVAIALEEFDDDAVQTISEAVDIWKKLNSNFAEFISYRRRLINALCESGTIRSQTDDPGIARSIFEEALEKAKALLEEDIENSVSLELFGDVCFSFARHELKNNNRERAMQLANDSLEKFETAIEAQPLSQTLAEKLNDARELLRENEE